MQLFSSTTGRASSRVCAILFFLPLTSTALFAATVQGTVRDPLGRGVVAHVSLLRDGREVAEATTNPDGTFQLFVQGDGRFVLRASAAGLGTVATQTSYAGAKTVLEQDVHLRIPGRRDDVTVTATGLPTPVEQTSVAVTLIPQQELATRFGIADELRLQPGVSVVQRPS